MIRIYYCRAVTRKGFAVPDTGSAAKSLSQLVQGKQDELGWNGKVAARRCGLNYSTYMEIAAGRTREPPPATLRALADGLGLPMYDLMEAAYGAAVLRGLRPAD